MVKSLSEFVDFALDGPVATLTLNRGRKQNALTLSMVESITGRFADIDVTDVRVIVIRGSGGNFCAGGDLKEMLSLYRANEVEAAANYSSAMGHMLHAVHNCPAVTIALVEGVAVGGGLGLACAADIVVAADNAVLALPETSLGLVPAQIAPFIVKRAGSSIGKLIAVAGAPIEPHRALRIGIVDYLACDPETIDELAKKVITGVLSCAPGANAAAKALFDLCSDEAVAPEHLADIFTHTLFGGEAREGILAFSEQRNPSWCVKDE